MKFNALRRRFEDQGTSFVIRDFEDFYLQLLKYKSIIAGTPVTQDELEAIAPQAISDTLKTILERMSMDASQKGGEYAASYFEEATFIMSALADEFFLNLTWEGRQYWEDHLLESRLFGTHDAGDIFFKNLDNFLGARDPMRRDLAEVYLLALGLGFQGKYRNTEDGGTLKAYRHQLYIFVIIPLQTRKILLVSLD
jgi:type VI secretion system protein ImpK